MIELSYRYKYDLNAKKKNFLTRIDPKVLKKFQSKARKEKVKIQDLIEQYMKDFINNHR